MSKACYDIIDGATRKVKKQYGVIGGMTRKIKKSYDVVGGLTRLFFGSGELKYYRTITSLTNSTAHAAGSNDSYAIFRPESIESGLDAYDKSLTKLSVSTAILYKSSVVSTAINNYVLFGGGMYIGDTVGTVEAYDESLTKTTPASFSKGRYQHVATSNHNYALFGGGRSDASANYFTTIEAYNKSLTKTTTSLANYARYYLAAASVGDHALFGGGYEHSNRTSTYSESYMNDVEAFNGSLTRTILTNLSTGRRSLSAASVGNYAIFAGGEYGYSTGYTTNTVSTIVADAYDTSLTRISAPSLSVARGDMGTTTVEGFAIFAGGYCNKGLSGGSASSSAVDAYDASLTRTTMTSLPSTCRSPGVASIGNYALFNSSQNTRALSIYAVD